MSDLMRVADWPELLSSLRPDLYRSNAYRLLGLSVEATTRQIDQRSGLIKVGMAVDSDSPLSTLYGPPTPEEAEAAARHLRDPVNRFFHWLFWLWPAEEKGGPAAPDDIAALHNSAVLNHARALASEETAYGTEDGSALGQQEALWEKCLRCWEQVASSEEFLSRLSERAESLGDPRLTTHLIEGTVGILPAAILALNGRLAVRAFEDDDRARAQMHLRVLRSHFQSSDQERAAEEAVVRVRDSLRQMVEKAGSDCQDTASRLGDACADLLKSAAKPLMILDRVLSPNHPAIQIHHDEVALKVLDMLIAYVNAMDEWRRTLDLLQHAAGIARGDQARNRLAENVKVVRKNLELTARWNFLKGGTLLEPTIVQRRSEDSTCWYCGKAPAEEDASIRVPFHRVTGRMRIGEHVRISWEKLDLKIPRCTRCQVVLQRSAPTIGLSCVGAWSLFIGPLILGYMVHQGIEVSITTWMGLGVVLPLVLSILGSYSWIPKMLGTNARRVKEYPALKDLQAEGWRIGEWPVI